MKKLIQLAKEKFDVVLIDLPPINVVTDAGVISSLVDGYVFVTRSGEDDVHSIRSALDSLQQMNANVLGVVLNGVDVKKNGSRYGRYQRYGYGDDLIEFSPSIDSSKNAAVNYEDEMSFADDGLSNK